jgi:hypothetical protein
LKASGDDARILEEQISSVMQVRHIINFVDLMFIIS